MFYCKQLIFILSIQRGLWKFVPCIAGRVWSSYDTVTYRRHCTVRVTALMGYSVNGHLLSSRCRTGCANRNIVHRMKYAFCVLRNRFDRATKKRRILS